MVSFEDVKTAYNRIHEVVIQTPVMTSLTANRIANCNIFFKCENFQRIGAFKFRGAYNAISQLSPEERKRGVIAHSSGNHAQAVALASAAGPRRRMMLVPLRNATGETVGEIELRDDVFVAPVSGPLMHQALVRQLANARRGTHKAKTRSEV